MYCLPEHYRIRKDPEPFDDTPFTDEWQDAVYALAAEIAEREGYKTVLDFGCGSGFKLIKHLGHLDTLGFDRASTVRFLRKTYPSHKWEAAYPGKGFDLLICADVLEHISEPDLMLKELCDYSSKTLVLSTPLRRNGDLGPPANPHHAMEWSGEEFLSFVKQFVDVSDYKIVPANPRTQDLTQVVIATAR